MSKLVTGQVVLSGTAAQLSTDPKIENKFLVLKAPATNAATAYFGVAGVTTTTGHAIDPGESVNIDDTLVEGGARMDIQPQDIYVVGTNPDKVTWVSAGQ